MLSDRSIICFGGEDWWYHHPHSKAHLMRKFARDGNKVIFVNSISMGLPSLAHKDLLPRIKRKLGSYSKLARQTSDGITVVSPASLPFFGRTARRVNRRLLGAQIKRLAARSRADETYPLDCDSDCCRHDRNAGRVGSGLSRVRQV